MRAVLFGLGAATGFILVPLAIVEIINALAGDDPLPPLCDGEFENEECVEGDGFITCYFSGPIRPIN